MDVTLKQLCVEHDLTGIGVNVFGAPDRPYIGVYVHWNDAARVCGCGNGDTFDEAFAAALVDMAGRRAPESA